MSALRKAPSSLALDDIDAPLVMAFLDEMERARGITARTRNLRLTAVHSFFHFAAFEAPTHSAQIQRVLAIPAKRFTRALVPFLSRQEVDALLAAPDQRSWSGRRDHPLQLLIWLTFRDAPKWQNARNLIVSGLRSVRFDFINRHYLFSRFGNCFKRSPLCPS